MNDSISKRLAEFDCVERTKLLAAVAPYAFFLLYFSFAFYYRYCLSRAVRCALSATFAYRLLHSYFFVRYLRASFLPSPAYAKRICVGNGRNIEIADKATLPFLEIKIYIAEIVLDTAPFYRCFYKRHLKRLSEQFNSYYVQSVRICRRQNLAHKLRFTVRRTFAIHADYRIYNVKRNFIFSELI